jgi:TolA-binding protein
MSAPASPQASSNFSPSLAQMDAILNFIQKDRSGENLETIVEEAIDKADLLVEQKATELTESLTVRQQQTENNVQELIGNMEALDHLAPQEKMAQKLRDQIARLRELQSRANSKES